MPISRLRLQQPAQLPRLGRSVLGFSLTCLLVPSLSFSALQPTFHLSQSQQERVAVTGAHLARNNRPLSQSCAQGLRAMSDLAERRKAGILKLLKTGIETGDPSAVEVINPEKYIQHNPQTFTGREGLISLFQRISKTSPHVNLVRIFSDGDYVFANTEYDFSTRRIGFEVFRFEGEQTVEHWDNIQPRQGPNGSGHSMVDGPTEAVDLEKTEENRVSPAI